MLACTVTVGRDELEIACAHVIATAAGTVRQVVQSYRRKSFLAAASFPVSQNSSLTAEALSLRAGSPTQIGETDSDEQSDDVSGVPRSRSASLKSSRSARSARSARSYASSVTSINTDIYGNWADRDSDDDAELDDGLIDEVVLVGGSSRIPGVRRGNFAGQLVARPGIALHLLSCLYSFFLPVFLNFLLSDAFSSESFHVFPIFNMLLSFFSS